MTSRERVQKALSHAEPDRVPVDYWGDRLTTAKLKKAVGLDDTEELYQWLGIDLRYMEGSVYIGPEFTAYEDGSSDDIWGVRRKTVYVDPDNPEKGSYEHVIKNPLAAAESVREIENYAGWPSPDYFDYSRLPEMTDQFPGKCVVCGGDRLNRMAQLKPAMYLRGVEQCMLDIALNPEIFEAIVAKETEFFLEYGRRLFEKTNGKVDVFFMGDDFASQTGLLMSIDHWRRFLKPGFRAYIDLAHKYNIKVMHHTCGAVYDLIPEFIDCGLDILQSLQPKAAGMDLKKIKQEFGKDLCFQGGVDIQETMPHGTPGDVKREVRERIKILGEGGGYILGTAHNMLPDVPVENALAYFEAAKEYG